MQKFKIFKKCFKLVGTKGNQQPAGFPLECYRCLDLSIVNVDTGSGIKYLIKDGKQSVFISRPSIFYNARLPFPRFPLSSFHASDVHIETD